MKKSILAAFVVAALCGNSTFASTPSQDKPVVKTTTTVKKSTPAKNKTTATTKSVHTKHMKKS